MSKTVHAGHRKRMRQKILDGGISGFQDHEVLEYLLFYTIPRKNTNELGHLILNKFGSFSALYQASIDEICEIPGISRKSAAFIKHLPQLEGLFFTDDDRFDSMPLFESSTEAVAFVRQEFYGITTSTFKLFCLTGALRLINTVTAFESEFTGSPDEMLKIVSILIDNRCRDVILAANHVVGTFLPSKQELNMINRLSELFRSLDIRLVDYIIVSGDGIPLSLKDSGYLT